MRRLAAVLVAMSLGTLALGGCAVGLMVPGPPPAPMVEVRGVAPGPAFVWIGGCWTWRSRWVWTGGSWGVPPPSSGLDSGPVVPARRSVGVEPGVLALRTPALRRRPVPSTVGALYSGQGAPQDPRHG